MTIALYRRYRPDTFADVVGQDHVTEILKTALDSGRVSHAYLFSGPRGCGKTTSARIMARCLNCEQGPTSEPCGECDSCKDLAAGGPGSLDVVEIDAASHNGVDDARDLRERAAFAPTRDRYKIFILDEAHMVTAQGFNALLKLVEEPPPHVKFIFATTEPEKVIGTIRSRTHHYPFRLVAPAILIPYLQELCEKENITVEEGVLPMVVRAGGGSVRDSLSVLDQLMAGATDGQLSYDQSVALLGFTDSSLLDGTIDALGSGDGAGVFQMIEQVVGSGHDPRRFVEDLLQRVRDLLICALAPSQATEILPYIPADQMERMHSQAQTWGTRLLSRRADQIEEALRTMSGATSPRLQLELLMGRLLVEATPVPEMATPAAVPAPTVSAPAVPAAKAVEQPATQSAPVSRGTAAPAPARQRTTAGEPTPTPSSEPVAKPLTSARTKPQAQPTKAEKKPASTSASVRGNSGVAEGTQTSGGGDISAVQAKWDMLAAEADKLSRVSGALLRQARPQSVNGNVINLAVSGTLDKLQPGTAHHSNIQTAVQNVFGAGWSFAVSDGSTPATPSTSSGTEAPAEPQVEKLTPKQEPADLLPKQDAKPKQAEPIAAVDEVDQSNSKPAAKTPVASTGWGPVAIPGGANAESEPTKSEPNKKDAALPVEKTASRTTVNSNINADLPPMEEPDEPEYVAPFDSSSVDESGTGDSSSDDSGSGDSGWISFEQPIDDEPQPETEPEDTSVDTTAVSADDDGSWGDEASLDDENIKGPSHLGLPTLLEVLGGKVIEEITEGHN